MNDARREDVYTIGWVLRPLAAARRRLLVALVLGALAGAAYWLLAPRDYESGLTLLPGAEDSGSLFSGAGELAALAGLQLPGGVDPSLVYPTVIRSDDLLDAVLATDFGEATIRTAFGHGDADDAAAEARESLRERLRIRRDQRSGIVEVRVQAGDPDLAAATARALRTELDRYYRETRTTRAGQQRVFLDARVEEVGGRLAAAEEALAAFRVRNRGGGDSPELALQESRLEREVLIRQTTYLELIKQLELARIAENRDIPALETLDVARRPLRAVSPRPVHSVLTFALLFLALAVVHAYFRAYTLPLLRRELESR